MCLFSFFLFQSSLLPQENALLHSSAAGNFSFEHLTANMFLMKDYVMAFLDDR
jgi:hypothetical protein